MDKNNFPIREDTSYISNDEGEMKLGWRIHEIPPDKTEEEYYKEILSEEQFEEWQYSHSTDRLSEVDRADFYKNDGYNGGSGKSFAPAKSCSFGSLHVLRDLWGATVE